MPGRQSSSRTLRSRNRHCRPRQSTALDRLPMNDHALRGRGNDAHVRCPRGNDRHHLNARQRLRAYEPVRSRDCGLGRTLLPEARTRLSQRARGSLRSSGPMCLVRSASVFGTNREGVAAASLRRRRIRRSRKTDRKNRSATAISDNMSLPAGGRSRTKVPLGPLRTPVSREREKRGSRQVTPPPSLSAPPVRPCAASGWRRRTRRQGCRSASRSGRCR